MRNKFIFVLGLTLLFLANAQTHTHTASEVVYTAHDDGFEGPEELPAGFVNITLQNEGERNYTFVFLRRKEGTTDEALIPAVEAVDRAFAEGGDASTALNEVLEVAEVVGQGFVEPDGSQSFGTILEAGNYVIFGTAAPEEAGALPVSTHRNIEVAAGETRAEAPQADVTVQMVDFAFALPPNIRAGEQIWEVINVGEQIHHLVLLRLAEGRTMEDLMAFMQTYEGEDPTENVGHVGMISPGVSHYATFDLVPGAYIALCFVPDHRGEATGQPHVALGMMQTFVIDEQ